MNGATLVSIEEVVCICADLEDPVVEDIRAWTATNDRSMAAYPVGAAVPEREADEVLGIAIGGDGTFLEAVRTFAPRQIPVAGVNRGTLSFLTHIPPANVGDALDEITHGESRILERQQVTITCPGLDTTGINDVMVEPVRSDTRPAECRLHVFVDEEYVGRYVGGGVSVSPPTGSTAMALSAGGAIHHPDGTETLQVVALHPDRLGVRPLVVDADREITVVPERTVRCTVDGGRSVTTIDGETPLRMTGADQRAFVVRTSLGHSFLDALVEKLEWGIRGPATDTPAAPGDAGDRGTVASADAGGRGTVASADAGDLSNGAFADAWDLSNVVPTDGVGVGKAATVAGPDRAVTLAREAAIAAGQLLVRYRQRADEATGARRDRLLVAAERKSRTILTTILERTSSTQTIRVSTEARSSDTSTGTETGQESAVTEGRVWLLDPIDGRTNYEHDNPNYCTTVSLLDDGTPLVGVVYAPETGELFHAIRGRAAFRNGVRIEPTDRDVLEESMLLSGYDPDGRFLRVAYQHTRGVRRLGSQALNLCFIAAGSADALWEYDTYPADVAAGLCILRAAGGRVTGPDGDPFELETADPAPLLASNGPLHPAVLSLFDGTETADDRSPG